MKWILVALLIMPGGREERRELYTYASQDHCEKIRRYVKAERFPPEIKLKQITCERKEA